MAAVGSMVSVTYSKLVPRALLRALCTLSGHVGHERDCDDLERPCNKNGGFWCLPEEEYERLMRKAPR